MIEQIIPTIIDKHLDKIVSRQLNALPRNIASEMRSDQVCEDEDWFFWLPIASKVSDEEIAQWEDRTKHPLPQSYRTFLKHKHFYELPISEASFFEHPIHTWQASLAEVVFSEYAQPFLLGKGYLPFAHWSDWGYLCFDTNRDIANHDYPVVLWDHENVDEVQDFAGDFTSLLYQLDQQEQQNPIFR
ncbi:MAG: SMI1/KNR4 family protein [Eikenella corrodens]|uniref:SMI1/KNR4 family protein n=1 Tax=Eikenella TaxID=538 RepID=UPI0008A61FD0|nr:MULTISPECIES: SMI1/KNR4 family protein [unclassified Eikenella]OFK87876.1 hypothetical protein HMPREF2796_05975 [Eikenella sp. HMSC071B05]OFO47623.1 hypothetical protein HMPREF3043_01635 [Eikenella sp. HMSC073A11]